MFILNPISAFLSSRNHPTWSIDFNLTFKVLVKLIVNICKNQLEYWTFFYLNNIRLCVKLGVIDIYIVIMKISLPVDLIPVDTNTRGTFESPSLFTQPWRSTTIFEVSMLVKQMTNLIQQDDSSTNPGRYQWVPCISFESIWRNRQFDVTIWSWFHCNGKFWMVY